MFLQTGEYFKHVFFRKLEHVLRMSTITKSDKLWYEESGLILFQESWNAVPIRIKQGTWSINQTQDHWPMLATFCCVPNEVNKT